MKFRVVVTVQKQGWEITAERAQSSATFSWRGRKRDMKPLSQQLSLMQSLQSLSPLRLNAIFIDYFKSIL